MFLLQIQRGFVYHYDQGGKVSDLSTTAIAGNLGNYYYLKGEQHEDTRGNIYNTDSRV